MSPDDNVISSGSPVIESSYVELEDGKAKMQSCLYFKNHLRFSMCGTRMRSMNELSRYHHAGRSTYVSGSQPNGGTIYDDRRHMV